MYLVSKAGKAMTMKTITVLARFVFYAVVLCPHVFAIYSTNVTFPDYHKWRPLNSTRDDLYCPDTCKRFLSNNEPLQTDRCCSCEALPCTQINSSACGVTVERAHVEEYDVFGHSVLVVSHTADFYELVHRYGRLTSFPDNLCEFADSLMKMDISFNHISDISAIKCLNKLDTLILDSNEITVVDNDTFSHMEYIRVVSLRTNNIKVLQPQTNKLQNGNILQFDVSYNVMDYFDMSNIFVSGVICNVNCDGCQIIEQTNHVNINLTESSGYGYYSFKNSSQGAWINFTSAGLVDFAELFKFVKGRFEYDNSAMICDCSLYPVFASVDSLLELYPNLPNVICSNPDYMKNRSLILLYESKLFEELICHLPNCPYKCQCTDVPVREAVFVKCTEQTSLPEFMPIGNWNNRNIMLDLSDNSNRITRVSNKDYLDRIVSLNLSNNDIIDLDSQAIENLDDNHFVSMDVSGQKLDYLPSTFYRRDPNRIHFGTNPVQCDCFNTWIGDWIRSHEAYNRLWCSTQHGVYLAESVTREFLNCDEHEQYSPLIKSAIITVSLIAFAAILCVSLAHYFRYELFLLKRRHFNDRSKTSECEFDVMISFSDNNDEMFEWISKTVIQKLEDEGYSLFVPYFNSPLGGEDKETAVAKGIQNSKHYVICMCRKYLCDDNAVRELETTWNKFYKDTSKNFIIINWENLGRSEISSKQLRAACRIRDDLNYLDRDTKLLDRLIRRLGPVQTPIHKRKRVFGDRTNDVRDVKPTRSLKQNAIFEGGSKPTHRGHHIQTKRQLFNRYGETSDIEQNSNTRFKSSVVAEQNKTRI